MELSRETLSRGLPVFVMLVLVSVAGRLLPHPPNFTPVAATALFAGFFFRSRLLALAVPMLAMSAADMSLGAYDYRVMLVVYAALMVPALGGALLRGRLSVPALGFGALASSVLFFLSTNLAVWAFAGWYPPTASGLGTCLTAALPFFKYTLSGDVFFTAVLFGTYALSRLPYRAAATAS